MGAKALRRLRAAQSGSASLLAIGAAGCSADPRQATQSIDALVAQVRIANPGAESVALLIDTSRIVTGTGVERLSVEPFSKAFHGTFCANEDAGRNRAVVGQSFENRAMGTAWLLDDEQARELFPSVEPIPGSRLALTAGHSLLPATTTDRFANPSAARQAAAGACARTALAFDFREDDLPPELLAGTVDKWPMRSKGNCTRVLSIRNEAKNDGTDLDYALIEVRMARDESWPPPRTRPGLRLVPETSPPTAGTGVVAVGHPMDWVMTSMPGVVVSDAKWSTANHFMANLELTARGSSGAPALITTGDKASTGRCDEAVVAGVLGWGPQPTFCWQNAVGGKCRFAPLDLQPSPQGLALRSSDYPACTEDDDGDRSGLGACVGRVDKEGCYRKVRYSDTEGARGLEKYGVRFARFTTTGAIIDAVRGERE